MFMATASIMDHLGRWIMLQILFDIIDGSDFLGYSILMLFDALSFSEI